jgi:hypothetical protein
MLIGVRADGTRELIAMDEGYRESDESSAELLRGCVAWPGMRAPDVAALVRAGAGFEHGVLIAQGLRGAR